MPIECPSNLSESQLQYCNLSRLVSGARMTFKPFMRSATATLMLYEIKSFVWANKSRRRIQAPADLWRVSSLSRTNCVSSCDISFRSYPKLAAQINQSVATPLSPATGGRPTSSSGQSPWKKKTGFVSHLTKEAQPLCLTLAISSLYDSHS